MTCPHCGEPGFMRLIPPFDRRWCQVCGGVVVDASCSGMTVMPR